VFCIRIRTNGMQIIFVIGGCRSCAMKLRQAPLLRFQNQDHAARQR
jgi:hypothetical protein